MYRTTTYLLHKIMESYCFVKVINNVLLAEMGMGISLRELHFGS